MVSHTSTSQIHTAEQQFWRTFGEHLAPWLTPGHKHTSSLRFFPPSDNELLSADIGSLLFCPFVPLCLSASLLFSLIKLLK